MLPEEETWESEAGAIQSAQEEFSWERLEIIGSGTVSPTVGKPSEVLRRTPSPSSSSRRGRRSAWGPKAIPGARRPLPPPPELRTMS